MHPEEPAGLPRARAPYGAMTPNKRYLGSR
nr:MAG TPA: hypothetical protein [Caudoviricetes sp.]